jgi:hypothetical protein
MELMDIDYFQYKNDMFFTIISFVIYTGNLSI